MSSNTSDLANKATKPYFKNKKKSFCEHCKQSGHIEPKCFIKYPELRHSTNSTKSNSNSNSNSNKNKDKNTKKDSYKKTESSKAIMSAFIASDETDYRLVLVSGATEHFTPIKEWLIDYKKVYNKYISIANGIEV